MAFSTFNSFNSLNTLSLVKIPISVFSDDTIRSFPPIDVTFSSNTSTITNRPYGNGTYVVTDSGGFAASAFSPYISPTNDVNYCSSQIYKPVYSGLINTNGTYGLWNQVKFPSSLTISSVSLTGRLGQGPASFKIFGSNDGSTWTSASDTISCATNSATVYPINNTSSYNYYRLVVPTGSDPNSGYMSISRIIWIGK